MNSLTLKESGFSQPFSLKTISFSNLPSNISSVFAIIDTSLTGKASTDILYIGRSKRPAKKILGGLLAGYGGKNTKKINFALLSDGYIEKTALIWVSNEKPRVMQKELLDKYVKEHGKVPAWNAYKKKLVKTQKVAPVKAKSTGAAQAKAIKAEKKPTASAKTKASAKPSPAKSTIPPKVTTTLTPTEPANSTSSNNKTPDSSQKPD